MNPESEIINNFVCDEKILTSDLVIQHNNLIEANYDLSLQEKRIVLWLSSKVGKDDAEFKNHEIRVTDFCCLAGIDPKCMYKEIEKTTKSLMRKVLTVKKIETNSVMLVSWLSYAEYFYKEGKVVLRFDPALTEFLLNIKERFTPLSLKQMLSFKSFYTIRLYEVLRKNLLLGSVAIPLKQIKDVFGVSNKYKSYNSFKTYVLAKASAEVNQKSDLHVICKEIKTGRKVTSIQFLVQRKLPENGIDQSLIDDCKKFNIGVMDLNQLRNEFPAECIKQGVLVLKTHKGVIKNPFLFLKKSIEGGWKPFFENEQKVSAFNVSECQQDIASLTEDPECIQFRKLFLEKEGESVYQSWLRNQFLFIENGCLVVGVKTQFTKDWMETNYLKTFEDCSNGRVVICRVLRQTGVTFFEGPIESSKPKATNIKVETKKVKLTQKKAKAEQKKQADKKSLWQKIKGFWK